MLKTGERRIKNNTLNNSEKQVLAKKLYDVPSYFNKKFSTDSIEFDITPHAAALRLQIERLLLDKKIITALVPLEDLHIHLSDEMKAYNFNDGVNKISSFFYETDEAFSIVYFQMVQFLLENIVKEHFWFQTVPTIRVHCPNAINAELYPRYHTDICYGHPPEEFNIWMPLTHLGSGHGFNVMRVSYSKKVMAQFDFDYPTFIEKATVDRQFSAYCDSLADPVTTDFGKILLFDSRSVHSATLVKQTRISIDIRILPIHLYENMDIEYEGLGRRKILFSPGHCYHEKNTQELFG